MIRRLGIQGRGARMSANTSNRARNRQLPCRCSRLMRKSVSLAAVLLCLVGTRSPLQGFSITDQYMLELINWSRANPQDAADSYLDGDLNEGLSPGTITATPKQPLAFDPSLNAAAFDHTQDMIANNYFSHTGSDGSSSHGRMTSAGYPFSGAWGSGENLAARGPFDSASAAAASQLFADLFIDSTIDGRGHRLILMNPFYENIGLSMQHTPSFGPFGGVSANLVTQDFGYTSALGPFVTGVAYNDLDGNNFYTPGEGLAGLDVTVFLSGTSTIANTTTTIDTGGYALDLTPGTYDLRIDGPLGTLSHSGIVLSSQNIKFDYTGASAIPEPASLLLLGSGLAGMIVMRRKRRD